METKDLHQTLMTQAHTKWNTDTMTYNDFISSLPKNERYAVLLGNMNYQVCNGGWIQWCDNGYCTELMALRKILLEMNTEMSTRIAVMLNKVAETLKDEVLHDGVSKGFGGDYFANMESEDEDCTNCNGTGEVDDEDDDGNVTKVTCDWCHGDGYTTNEPTHPNFDSIDSEYYTFNDLFLIECGNFLATL
jgi:hypothetical protein